MYSRDIKFEDVISFQSLYQSGLECCKGVMWKTSTQVFRYNLAPVVQMLHHQLEQGTYRSRGFNTFKIHERGKVRIINSVHITERCVQKSLCNNALKPLLVPTLIYDNAASQKGKGVSFAINRLLQHLRDHYKSHGLKGGILIMDYHNFFGSISHDKLLQQLESKIKDKRIFQLVSYFINCFEGDKGLGLGNEISQVCAIYYPNSIDHYVKEHLHIKGYARYMDDSYIIHEDLDYLKVCLNKVEELAKELGLELNTKRVQIIPFKGGHFTYLKRRIHFTNTGKIIMRPVKSNIKRRKRLLRSFKNKYDKGEMKFEDIFNSYSSWRGYLEGCGCTYNSLRAIDKYFSDLFHEAISNLTEGEMKEWMQM